MPTIAAFLQQVADWTQLDSHELVWMGLVVLAAGVVRGFAGFGLGAVIVTSLAPLLPPVVLMPVCLLLEVVISAFTVRGSWREADTPTVRLLAFGMAVGLPLGLLTTTQVSAETSKLVALVVVALLAGAQLVGVQANAFRGRYAPHVSGVLAGFVSGVAGAGGMVSALYFLASRMAASTMRASLMLNLMISIFTTSIFYTLFDLLNALAVQRAVVLLPLALLGLRLGTALFRPSLTPYYRRFCLGLLLLLSLSGLSRLG